MQTGSAIIEDWERLRTVDVNVVYYTRYEMSDVGVQMSESMVSGWMSNRMSETVAHSGTTLPDCQHGSGSSYLPSDL
jgi:hypothetical protein